MNALTFNEANFAAMKAMLDRATDMLFATSGALKDREMPKLAEQVSGLAMEINERVNSGDHQWQLEHPSWQASVTRLTR